MRAPFAPPAASSPPSRSTAQRADFKRLGVFGDWEHPYLTMDPRYEAQQIRALGKIIANGHLYRGAKPVHWCLDCRSALAEAEVEYEDRTSTAIDVAFRVRGRRRLRAALQALRPAHRRAPGLGRDLDHHALDAAGQRGGGAARRLRLRCGARSQRGGTPRSAGARRRPDAARAWRATACAGADARRVARARRSRACSSSIPGSPKQVPVILGDHVTLEAGTGAVHTAPAHGQEDYRRRQALWAAGGQSGRTGRPLRAGHPLVAGLQGRCGRTR